MRASHVHAGGLHTLTVSHSSLMWSQELCPRLPDGARIVINCSGRGDKDVNTAMALIEGIDQDQQMKH